MVNNFSILIIIYYFVIKEIHGRSYHNTWKNSFNGNIIQRCHMIADNNLILQIKLKEESCWICLSHTSPEKFNTDNRVQAQRHIALQRSMKYDWLLPKFIKIQKSYIITIQEFFWLNLFSLNQINYNRWKGTDSEINNFLV